MDDIGMETVDNEDEAEVSKELDEVSVFLVLDCKNLGTTAEDPKSVLIALGEERFTTGIVFISTSVTLSLSLVPEGICTKLDALVSIEDLLAPGITTPLRNLVAL